MFSSTSFRLLAVHRGWFLFWGSGADRALGADMLMWLSLVRSCFSMRARRQACEFATPTACQVVSDSRLVLSWLMCSLRLLVRGLCNSQAALLHATAGFRVRR